MRKLAADIGLAHAAIETLQDGFDRDPGAGYHRLSRHDLGVHRDAFEKVIHSANIPHLPPFAIASPRASRLDDAPLWARSREGLEFEDVRHVIRPSCASVPLLRRRLRSARR